MARVSGWPRGECGNSSRSDPLPRTDPARRLRRGALLGARRGLSSVLSDVERPACDVPAGLDRNRRFTGKLAGRLGQLGGILGTGETEERGSSELLLIAGNGVGQLGTGRLLAVGVVPTEEHGILLRGLAAPPGAALRSCNDTRTFVLFPSIKRVRTPTEGHRYAQGVTASPRGESLRSGGGGARRGLFSTPRLLDYVLPCCLAV